MWRASRTLEALGAPSEARLRHSARLLESLGKPSPWESVLLEQGAAVLRRRRRRLTCVQVYTDWHRGARRERNGRTGEGIPAALVRAFNLHHDYIHVVILAMLHGRCVVT